MLKDLNKVKAKIQGNFLVMDGNNYRILRIQKDGIVIQNWTSGEVEIDDLITWNRIQESQQESQES